MWVFWIIVLSAVVRLVVFYGTRSREARSTPARAARTAPSPIGGQPGTNVALDGLGEFLTALREGSVELEASVVANPPIALKQGESLAVVCYEVILREARTVQQGVHGGPRLRTAKNLSFNLGGLGRTLGASAEALVRTTPKVRGDSANRTGGGCDGRLPQRGCRHHVPSRRPSTGTWRPIVCIPG